MHERNLNASQIPEPIAINRNAAQAALAKLFPNARHITNTSSRHCIHLEQPQLVIDAIREVLGAVRDAKQRN